MSALARVEVPAAVWRKQRAGGLSASNAAVLTQAFEADILGASGERPRFAVLAVQPEILEEAAELVAAQDLRAYDAVQLASALAARAADPGCRSFACFDSRLSAAAAARGFEPVPGRRRLARGSPGNPR